MFGNHITSAIPSAIPSEFATTMTTNFGPLA